MNKIIARYKITYPDYADGNGMSQYKNLIEYDDYIEDIKLKYNEIALLEAEQTKYSKKNEKYKECDRKISELKSYIKKNYGDEFFTNKGLLYNSKNNNGIMVLPEWQGGEHRVILEISK